MNLEEAEAILEQALKNTLYEVQEEENTIGAELDKAWNRGAKTMMNETLALLVKRYIDQSMKEA